MGIAAKLHAALHCVGAGDIQFVGRNTQAFVEDFNRALIIFAGVAEDIREDDNILDLLQLRQFFFNERARANVL